MILTRNDELKAIVIETHPVKIKFLIIFLNCEPPFYLFLDVFKKALPLGRFIAVLFTFGLSSLLHVSIITCKAVRITVKTGQAFLLRVD